MKTINISGFIVEYEIKGDVDIPKDVNIPDQLLSYHVESLRILCLMTKSEKGELRDEKKVIRKGVEYTYPYSIPWLISSVPALDVNTASNIDKLKGYLLSKDLYNSMIFLRDAIPERYRNSKFIILDLLIEQWHYGGMFHDKGRAVGLIDEICTDYNVKLT